MSATNPSGMDNSVPKVSANVGVEDLSKMLLEEFSDDYKEDIDKIKGAKIDGEYFLSILKDEFSLEIEVSPGFTFHLNKNKQKLIGMILEQTDNTRKSLVTKTPITPVPITSWCTTIDHIVGSEIDSDGMLMPACASPRYVWRSRKVLLVQFLGAIPKDWTCAGSYINFENIISWANQWSHRGGGVIPSFKMYTDEAKSDIRVCFNNKKRNESSVGRDAENVHSDEPTMWLDLSQGPDSYKKHLVIHEFGHALGLYHEHQRSDFWMYIEPYIDKSRMKADLRMSDDAFKERYDKLNKTESAAHTKYDPKSVMHYWFKKNWLTHGYANEDKVKRDLEQKRLPEKSAKAIQGIHMRHESLADEPSALDMELLKKLYKDASISASRTILGPPPTKKQRLSPVADDYDYCDQVDNNNINHLEVKNHFLSLIRWKESENEEVQELRIYDSAKAKWDRIGRRLGFDEGHIESISDDGRNNYSRICKVFQEWFDNACSLPNHTKYPMTWEGLVALLADSALKELSEKLKRALVAPFSEVRGDKL